MAKHLHAVEKDGTTFGMSIDAATKMWRSFKASIKKETCISVYGHEFQALVVPYLKLAAIMGEAHWLVTELKDFVKIQIDDGPEIYVKYSDGPVDFRKEKTE
ncbi:MAG: hypothetical protein ACI4II_04975 [Acutalibacteraceae bacterium]